MKIVLWISLFIIFYTYVGYGIVLYFLVKLKRFFIKTKNIDEVYFTPSLTLVVAAYNEEKIIEEKASPDQDRRVIEDFISRLDEKSWKKKF